MLLFDFEPCVTLWLRAPFIRLLVCSISPHICSAESRVVFKKRLYIAAEVAILVLFTFM